MDDLEDGAADGAETSVHQPTTHDVTQPHSLKYHGSGITPPGA